MVEDTDVPQTSTRAPWGEPWEGRWHEPPLFYLARTGELRAGEIERLRAAERTPGIGHTLSYWRLQAQRNPAYAHNIRRQPWELAAAMFIYDRDGCRELLTADELRAAGPYIEQLTVSVSQQQED